MESPVEVRSPIYVSCEYLLVLREASQSYLLESVLLGVISGCLESSRGLELQELMLKTFLLLLTLVDEEDLLQNFLRSSKCF